MKKIEDLTLKEVVELCKGECDSCPIKSDGIHDGSYCRFSRGVPMRWDISSKRKVCDEDLERLKTIKLLFPRADGVVLASGYTGSPYILSARYSSEKFCQVVKVRQEVFESIEAGGIVLFNDVEGME